MRFFCVTAPEWTAFGPVCGDNAATDSNLKHIMKSILILLTLGLSLGSVQARDFGRSSSFTGKRGTGSRVISGNATRGSGASRTATTTGAKGRTVTDSQQVNRTANGRASSGTVTGPNGKTATTNGSVTHADGTRTATRSGTGPNGQTKSETTTTTRNK